MSRLIDADAFSAVMKQRQDTVKEWMCKGKDKETCARAGSSYVMLCEVKLTLDQMPTIDAVEVVHCAECRWADWYKTKMGKFCHCLESEKRGLTETDYCSFGEKMDGEVKSDG